MGWHPFEVSSDLFSFVMSEFPPWFYTTIDEVFDEHLLCDSLTSQRTCQGSSALHFAVLGGNIKTVEIVIQHLSDVNASNAYGETALHWACKQGNLQVVHLLLNEGADVMSVDTDGNSPLHWAAEYDHSEVILHLLRRGARPSRNYHGLTPHQLARSNRCS